MSLYVVVWVEGEEGVICGNVIIYNVVVKYVRVFRMVSWLVEEY